MNINIKFIDDNAKYPEKKLKRSFAYDVYATKGLNTISSVEDYKLTSVDDIINVEQALFIIKEISMANLLDLDVQVNKVLTRYK